LNKLEFIELLKAPEKVSQANYAALEIVVKENPYFHSAHSVIARSSRILKIPSAAKKMNTAALYATNRDILKKYILGQIKFKSASLPSDKSANPPAPKTITGAKQPAKPRKAPQHLSPDEQSELIKEIYENLEKWKHSRDHYLEFDRAHPEEIIIEDPHAKSAQVEELKNQIAAEVIAEEETTAADSPDKVEETPAPQIAQSEVESEPPDEPASTSDKDDADKIVKVAAAPDIPASEAKQEKIPDTPEAIAQRAKEAGLTEAEIDDLLQSVADEKAGISSEKQASEESVDEGALHVAHDEELEISDVDELDLEDIVGESAYQEVLESIEQDSQPLEPVEESVEIVAEEPQDFTEEIIEEAEVAEKIDEKSVDEEEITLDLNIDSDKSIEETEEELVKLDQEKQSLKLTPGLAREGAKKFRLSFMRPTSIRGKGKKARPSTASKTTKVKPTTENKKSASEIVAKQEEEPATKKTIKKIVKTKKAATVKSGKAEKIQETTSKKKITSKSLTTKKTSTEKDSKNTTPKTTKTKFKLSTSIVAKVKNKIAAKKKAKKATDENLTGEKKKSKK